MDDVQRETIVDASPEELWDAITDDERRAAWMGGDTAIDVRPGGAGHVTDHDGVRREVRVDEVDEGRRLSFDWWEADAAASRVTFIVAPSEEGTRLTVTETRGPTASASAAGPRVVDRVLDLELSLLLRSSTVRC